MFPQPAVVGRFADTGPARCSALLVALPLSFSRFSSPRPSMYDIFTYIFTYTLYMVVAGVNGAA